MPSRTRHIRACGLAGGRRYPRRCPLPPRPPRRKALVGVTPPSTTVVDRILSWFQTPCGGRNQGAEARAESTITRLGPGDGACLGRLADRRSTLHHATFGSPRSPSPGVGVSPGVAVSSRAQKRVARGRSQRGDHAVWAPASVRAGAVEGRGGPGGLRVLWGRADGRSPGRARRRCDRVAHKRPACGWGGTPRAWDSRPRGTVPHGGMVDLGESPGPCRARSCTRSPPRVDQRRSALHGRGDAGGAPRGDHAAARAADAEAGLRRGGPSHLGSRGACRGGAAVVADGVGGTPARLGLGRLGESRGLAGRPATADHNPPGDVGACGLVSMACRRRAQRPPVVGLAMAAPGRAAPPPRAPLARGTPESARPHYNCSTSTSLDCLIRLCAIFVALRACYAALCRLARLLPGKDGSRPYSTLYGHFLRLPFQQPNAHASPAPGSTTRPRLPQTHRARIGILNAFFLRVHPEPCTRDKQGYAVLNDIIQGKRPNPPCPHGGG